jgi:predicted membrane-bound spermidine synthase/tetratricopeptide (TPR) repeat protein
VAALIYEQLWIRELQQVFGSTIHAITTVVAAYMGGLGLGAWVGGRRADGTSRPAAWYGGLELAIGLFGLASPWIIGAVGEGWLRAASALQPGLWAGTVMKFAAAFTVMLVPTFLMGATLPLLTRAFTGPGTGALRHDLGLLYGLNTVGGVIGCALAGYVLIERVGQGPTLLATGGLNLVLGACAVLWGRTFPAPVAPGAEEAAAPSSPEVRRLALRLLALTAFASLLYEIAWTRVLVLVVGSSTYAFTTILACFLLGIGIGSLVAQRRRASMPTLLLAATVQGAVALLASLIFPFFRMLPAFIVETLQVRSLPPTALIVIHSAALAVVITPPAVGMGMAFPLLTELAVRPGAGSGAETGRAYWANTLGSIAGSVVTGFILIHALGAERTLLAGVAMNAAAAIALAWSIGNGGGWRSRLRLPVGLAAAALVIALATPSWSTRLLDRGPALYGRDIETTRQRDGFLRGRGSEQLAFTEGWNATVSVWRNGMATWLKSNGKADASSVADMNTQVLVGLLPGLAHPAPRRAFVVGFGSGVSVRALAAVRGVEQVDVAEIERAVLDAAPFFADVNADVLRDPRVRIIEDDARSALQLARQRYDVIASEPSNPWIAGVASLFTSDFYRIAAARLAPEGVFAQWFQTYRVPVGAVAVVVANLRQVFPHVELWFSSSADLLLLASPQPIRWDRSRLAAHLAPGTPSAALLRDWVRVKAPEDLLGHFLLGPTGLARLAAEASFRHTDDRPALEFVAARWLLAATPAAVVFDSLVRLQDAIGDTLPALGDWPLERGAWAAAAAQAFGASPRARALAERALVAAPHDADRKGELGRILREQGDAATARPLLEEALAARPDDGQLRLQVALAALAVGDTAAAVRGLEQARELGGDGALAGTMLAQVAAALGDHARALAEADRAVTDLRPTLARPFPPLLPVLRTLAFEAPPDGAAALLERVARERPSWDAAYSLGAWAHARAGRCDRAAAAAAQLARFGWTAAERRDVVGTCARR